MLARVARCVQPQGTMRYEAHDGAASIRVRHSPAGSCARRDRARDPLLARSRSSASTRPSLRFRRLPGRDPRPLLRNAGPRPSLHAPRRPRPHVDPGRLRRLRPRRSSKQPLLEDTNPRSAHRRPRDRGLDIRLQQKPTRRPTNTRRSLRPTHTHAATTLSQHRKRSQRAAEPGALRRARARGPRASEARSARASPPGAGRGFAAPERRGPGASEERSAAPAARAPHGPPESIDRTNPALL